MEPLITAKRLDKKNPIVHISATNYKVFVTARTQANTAHLDFSINRIGESGSVAGGILGATMPESPYSTHPSDMSPEELVSRFAA